MSENLPANANNFNLGDATKQVVELKKNVGKSVIALGEWIALTKENLPPEEFMDWLKYQVKISYITAWRYMRVSKSVDYKTLERVGPSKIYEILELPQGAFREGLMDMAETFTKRELQEASSERKPISPVKVFTPEDMDKSVDNLLKKGLEFLDELGNVDLNNLPDNFRDLAISQLNMMVKDINSFLDKLKDGR